MSSNEAVANSEVGTAILIIAARYGALAKDAVSGGEVRYIFWRRMGERRPGDMPLVDHRETFPLHAFR
jgi:hypothetical protein